MNKKKKPVASRQAPPAEAEAAVPLPANQAEAEKGFPIVGIGASAGGLAAFEQFFSAMPADTENGMAFVLVQHLSPDHKSILTDLVKRYTPMQVFEVEDGMVVNPNCTYIIPPNRDMAILNGTLQLLEPTSPRGVRLPIDFFFRSLAQDQHERAICVILSGTGSDGTLGLRAVKGEGGMVIVQDPDTTSYDGMPRSAIATGLVDAVLPAIEIPARLIAYVDHAFGKRHIPVSLPIPKIEDTLQKVCILLRAQTGHDFSQYKQNTLVRRVERRMALAQIERMDDYLRYLQKNTPELDALFRDVLIGVTSFFRDPEAFATLETQVISRLFAGKSPSADIRIWVCGCSTGEEAYSLAMLILEYMEAHKQSFKVQIFATDIDRQAIEQARSGFFPGSIATDISPERLARFFTVDEESHSYRIQKMVRDLLIFSEQDVIKDPPFSKQDMISCRNLLIYMNTDLQKRLIPLFHYALNPEGVLFLGASETVGEYTNLFHALDRKWKVYLRREDLSGAARLTMGEFTPPLTEIARPLAHRGGNRAEKPVNLQEVVRQALLEHYGAAAVLVSGRGEVLYIHGRTGKYLEPAPGDAGMNILAMARSGLQRELAAALRRAVTERQPVYYHNLRVQTNGDAVTVNLTVRPITAGEGLGILPDVYLTILEEAPAVQAPPGEADTEPHAMSSEAETRIAALELELRNKEEYLQTTVEELETSNEELKSSNEELQSVNEELQSTNEELETSKEELQSVNEELATVNAELQNKVTELSRANNDMNNLLAGTGVATLFVDLHLRISRFTPAATQIINLIQSDVGRPVGHIASNLVGYSRLVEDIKAVLDTLIPQEAEVQTHTGAVYLMRVRPYRTLENVIEGAVITFVDITARKQMEEEFNRGKKQLETELTAMTWLNRLGLLFFGASDRQAILDEIVETAMAIAQADMGNLQLFDPTSNNLKIVAWRGFEQPFLDYWDRVSEGQGACGTALEHGERIIVEDITLSPIFVGTPALAVQMAAGIRAVQSTPLIGRSGTKLGVLSIHYKTSHQPDKVTLRLLDLLARQTTDIIERAQAEELLQKARAELETRVTDRTTKLDQLNDDLNRELAEHKRAQEIINNQLIEITSYYDNTPVGLAVLDANLRYIRINKLLAEINGIPAAEHIGKKVQEIVPTLAEQAEKLAARIIETGQAITQIEFHGETAAHPGVKRTWLEGWYPLKDDNGQVIGFSIIAQDITEHRSPGQAG